jgi:acetoin utilization protein AcuB
MQVKDVMTRSPITIDPDATLAAAIALLRKHEIRHLPVVGEAGRLVGILTDRDLRGAVFSPVLAEHLSAAARRRLQSLGPTVESLRVEDVMTKDVVTTQPEAPLAKAAAMMLEGRFGSLPVLEGGKLVGIVTERDALRELATTLSPVKGLPYTFLW